MKVMLAERSDYASATSSASSKLIHGGLRYLESFEFGLVRQSLNERDLLLKNAPHLVSPLRFLLPLTSDQRRSHWLVNLGLKLYDILAGEKSVASSGRLSEVEIGKLSRLRKDNLNGVFHYTDCRTDDARLVLSLLLDARERGADIANGRDVKAIRAHANGYRVELQQAGHKQQVDARFVVNATGPWANAVLAICDQPPPERALRLVRGSHIVLPMPSPPQSVAYTLQNKDGRVVFTLPWLDDRFLVIGTTDAPHRGDAAEAKCSAEERDYLLDAYNRYFGHDRHAARARDIVADWSGVRALADDGRGNPSQVTRSAHISHIAQGKGGMVSVYGGKLTTHRHLAEDVLDCLKSMGAEMSLPWTHDAKLYGGRLPSAELQCLAKSRPSELPAGVANRWIKTYGDGIRALFEMIENERSLAKPFIDNVPEAELVYAREVEDALNANDFLYRRTKLFIDLSPTERNEIEKWFEA